MSPKLLITPPVRFVNGLKSWLWPGLSTGNGFVREPQSNQCGTNRERLQCDSHSEMRSARECSASNSRFHQCSRYTKTQFIELRVGDLIEADRAGILRIAEPCLLGKIKYLLDRVCHSLTIPAVLP